MKERIKWVDVAKGWGIILVIYGHVANDYLFFWLYSFHVPLFFFLSGYFFNPQKKPKEFYKSKAKGLLLPYLTLGIPLFLVNLYFGFEPIEPLKGYLIQQRASTLWFIAALFMQFMIAYLLYQIKLHAFARWIIIGALSFTGITLWHNGILSLPWNIDVSIVALPFFCLGHDIREAAWFKTFLSTCSTYPFICIFLVLSIIGTIVMRLIPFPYVDLCASQFSFEPLAYIVAMIGITATCLISNKWYSKSLEYIGKNSLVYFVWQQDIALMTISLVMKKFHFMENVTGITLFAKNILFVILALIILTFLNEVIIRTKLRKLIGK